jgi:hypothetical protein
MALTYDQISAITQKKFIPKLYDNIFDSNPLLQRAKKKFYERVDGGTSIIVPLNYAQASAGGWYQGAETLSLVDNDVITGAEYQWKQIYKSIIVSRIDELKNSGDAAILKFVKQKVQIAEKSIMDDMGTGLYSAGTDSKAIGGLRLIVGTSNTVGGISQTDNSWWQSQLDSSTTTLSMSALQALDNRATIGSDAPTVIMTTRTLYNSYYAMLQPQQRFQSEETAKGGFTSLMFNSKPVIVDSHVPSGYLFGINENYLHLFYHPEEDFRMEPFKRLERQNVKAAQIFWAGALGSSNNRMHFGFSALTG